MKLKMYYPAVIEVIGKMLKLLEIPIQTTFAFGNGGTVPAYIFDMHSLCTCFLSEASRRRRSNPIQLCS